MSSLNRVIAGLLLISGWSSPVWSDSTIVILRHAEKPALGLGQLTCQGLNRSLALPSILISRYGQPTAIYAPNPAVLKKDKGVPYAYVRPLATIEPLAIRSGLPIQVKFGMTQVDSLAGVLLKAPTGTKVVAWEHHWGEALAKRLLIKMKGDPNAVPKWEDADFDSVYVIHIRDDEHGHRTSSFIHEQEGLNGLPETCTEVSVNPH